MVRWAGNPFQGSGTVNPVLTGTRDEAFQLAPLRDQGLMLGIDQTGDGVIDLSPTPGENGFLDASGVFQPFELNPASRVVLDEASFRRSFYISSETDFYLTAQAFPAPGGRASQLDTIGFVYGVTREGLDDGMAFGSAARRGNFIRDIGQVSDLGDLAGAPVSLLEFRHPIAHFRSDSLPEQSVRFDYVYGFAEYDLSMGAGDLRYRLEFDFYNR